MDDFRVLTAIDGGVAVLRVTGELDAATAPTLDEYVRRVEAEQQVLDEIVVDIGDVTFIDSSGLSVLVAAHKRLRREDTGLVVANPSSQARRVFEIAGLHSVLTVR
ncbi:MAG TPA: STAS domain-containing protein [Acidimicrobiales bacterium]